MSPVHSAQLPLTPVEDRNAIKIHVPSKQLYFSIYYYTADNAFKRASETKEREIKNRPDWNPAQDTFVATEVRTEADFRAAWARVMKLAKDEGYVVAEGHLFTHASKPKGGHGGLEFAAIPGTGDGIRCRPKWICIVRAWSTWDLTLAGSGQRKLAKLNSERGSNLLAVSPVDEWFPDNQQNTEAAESNAEYGLSALQGVQYHPCCGDDAG